MKKMFLVFLLILMVFGTQSIFAKENSKELGFYAIYDCKFVGKGNVNKHSFSTTAEDSLFGKVGNFGLGISYRHAKRENLSAGPSLSIYWAQTKNHETYRRYSLGENSTLTLLNSKGFDLFSEVGVGLDWSQLGTCTTIGFDCNLALGFKLAFGESTDFVASAAINYLTEVYKRDGVLSSASQFDLPVRFGLAFKF